MDPQLESVLILFSAIVTLVFQIFIAPPMVLIKSVLQMLTLSLSDPAPLSCFTPGAEEDIRLHPGTEWEDLRSSRSPAHGPHRERNEGRILYSSAAAAALCSSAYEIKNEGPGIIVWLKDNWWEVTVVSKVGETRLQWKSPVHWITETSGLDKKYFLLLINYHQDALESGT